MRCRGRLEPSFDALGLKLGTVGLVFMVVRLLDIAFDPFIGGVMDRVRTRMGRDRPSLVVAAPIGLICSMLVPEVVSLAGAPHPPEPPPAPRVRRHTTGD